MKQIKQIKTRLKEGDKSDRKWNEMEIATSKQAKK